MIRASVLYPNEPGKKFDFDYYINRHMVMVRQRLAPYGLIRCEVDKATDVASPFLAVGHLYSTHWRIFRTAFLPTLMNSQSICRITDIPPQMQISEIVK